MFWKVIAAVAVVGGTLGALYVLMSAGYITKPGAWVDELQRAAAANRELQGQVGDLQGENAALERNARGFNSGLFWGALLLAVLLWIILNELVLSGRRYLKLEEAERIGERRIMERYGIRHYRKAAPGSLAYYRREVAVATPMRGGDTRDRFYIVAFALSAYGPGAKAPAHQTVLFGCRSLDWEYNHFDEFGLSIADAYEKHKFQIDRSLGPTDLSNVTEVLKTVAEFQGSVAKLREAEA